MGSTKAGETLTCVLAYGVQVSLASNGDVLLSVQDPTRTVVHYALRADQAAAMAWDILSAVNHEDRNHAL